jgi:hypothetical protein
LFDLLGQISIAGAEEREELADVGERLATAGADVLDESAQLLGACLGFRFGSGGDLNNELSTCTRPIDTRPLNRGYVAAKSR